MVLVAPGNLGMNVWKKKKFLFCFFFFKNCFNSKGNIMNASRALDNRKHNPDGYSSKIQQHIDPHFPPHRTWKCSSQIHFAQWFIPLTKYRSWSSPYFISLRDGAGGAGRAVRFRAACQINHAIFTTRVVIWPSPLIGFPGHYRWAHDAARTSGKTGVKSGRRGNGETHWLRTWWGWWGEWQRGKGALFYWINWQKKGGERERERDGIY